MTLVLEHVASPTPEACALIEALEAELSGSYAAEQRHGYDAARIFQPHVVFVVARLDGVAVGCGGVAFEHGAAELKRMYVHPERRGQHIGRAILNRLEAEAQARGAGVLRLETGDVLAAAIRLYECAGFVRCAAFEPYTALPPASIARSVFMQKPLA